MIVEMAFQYLIIQQVKWLKNDGVITDEILFSEFMGSAEFSQEGREFIVKFKKNGKAEEVRAEKVNFSFYKRAETKEAFKKDESLNKNRENAMRLILDNIFN